MIRAVEETEEQRLQTVAEEEATKAARGIAERTAKRIAQKIETR